MLRLILDAYSAIVLVSVVLSWLRLDPENPLVRFTSALTEPVLRPIRRVLPPMAGLDLSPMLLLIGLRILRSVLRI